VDVWATKQEQPDQPVFCFHPSNLCSPHPRICPHVSDGGGHHRSPPRGDRRVRMAPAPARFWPWARLTAQLPLPICKRGTPSPQSGGPSTSPHHRGTRAVCFVSSLPSRVPVHLLLLLFRTNKNRLHFFLANVTERMFQLRGRESLFTIIHCASLAVSHNIHDIS
jgi:hypothetical protein